MILLMKYFSSECFGLNTMMSPLSGSEIRYEALFNMIFSPNSRWHLSSTRFRVSHIEGPDISNGAIKNVYVRRTVPNIMVTFSTISSIQSRCFLFMFI